MKSAREHCGHQADLMCITKLIALNIGSAVVQNSSVCVDIEKIEEKDYLSEKMIKKEILSPKSWLDDIQGCESTTPIYK